MDCYGDLGVVRPWWDMATSAAGKGIVRDDGVGKGHNTKGVSLSGVVVRVRTGFHTQYGWRRENTNGVLYHGVGKL